MNFFDILKFRFRVFWVRFREWIRNARNVSILYLFESTPPVPFVRVEPGTVYTRTGVRLDHAPLPRIKTQDAHMVTIWWVTVSGWNDVILYPKKEQTILIKGRI